MESPSKVNTVGEKIAENLKRFKTLSIVET